VNRKDTIILQTRINTILPTLNEHQRRIYLATEAKTIGPGGISLVSRLSGITCPTITAGIKELNNPAQNPPLPMGKSRKKGGGRKPLTKTQPNLLAALTDLVAPHTIGDPMQNNPQTNKSLRSLQKSLNQQGFQVSYRVVGVMLKQLGYDLQVNKNPYPRTSLLSRS
jgi:hypothetical protein